MAYLAQHEGQYNARKITQDTHIALPTVTKILKLLTREGLLESHRGISGGYTLAVEAKAISVADIIRAIEGDWGLTECSNGTTQCFLEASCATRKNWRLISHIIYEALTKLSLADMARPLDANLYSSQLFSLNEPARKS